MENKMLKGLTLLILTVLNGLAIYYIYFYDKTKSLSYYLKTLHDFSSSNKTDFLLGLLIFSTVPFTVLFSSVMRSIDKRVERYKFSASWIVGIIFAIVIMIMTNICSTFQNYKVFFGIMIAIGGIFCLFAVTTTYDSRPFDPEEKFLNELGKSGCM